MKTLLLIGAVLLLVSCMKADDSGYTGGVDPTFQRNKECMLFSNKIINNLKSVKNKLNENVAIIDQIILEELFYSTAENSCLYVWRLVYTDKSYSKQLYDYKKDNFNNIPIGGCKNRDCHNFYEIVNSYK